jgi:CubicO group peptidase (beta-lactamase class C family)
MIARSLPIVIGFVFLFGASGAAAETNQIADIADVWDSAWGPITLKTTLGKDRKTLAVTGSYESNTGDNRKGIVKSGVFDPATGILEFSLEEPWWGNHTTGTAMLTLAGDGRTFLGPYLKVNRDGGRDEGSVALTRSIAGVWESPWGVVTLQTAPVSGQTFLSVSGFYAHAHDQTGLIKSGMFDPARGQLNFALEEPWWDNDTKGNATLQLAADGKKFEGGYVKTNKDGGHDAGLLSMTRGRDRARKPADITGIWDSPWGLITLRSTPAAGRKRFVHGSYDSITGANRRGLIQSGTFDQTTGVLEFALEEPWWGNQTKGHALLTLDDAGNRLQGRYLKTNQDGTQDEGNVGLLRLGGNDFAAALDSILADAGIGIDTPGAAVMVIEHGKIAFAKCAGLARLTDKKAITRETTFDLCSLGKQFTGAAILRLYDQGKLNLNDDIRKFIPEIPAYDPNNPIRIHHLARHTSGLPEGVMYSPDVKGKNPNYLTNEDFAGEFARQRDKFPLEYPTGQEYKYSNTGFMVLGLVQERAAKQSYSDYIKKELFEPLGMTTAWINDSPNNSPPNPAYAYHRVNDTFQFGTGPASITNFPLLMVGHGGVCASLDDMARWDAGWRQGKIIKADTQKKALATSKLNDGRPNSYAYGWWLTFDNEKLQRMGHNGAYAGFLTYYERDLENDRSLVVLANVDSFDVDAVVRIFHAMPPL